MTTQLSTPKLYDQDFNRWIEQTIRQIKNHEFNVIDWENLLEEIESLSRSDKREIKRRVTIILSHLICLVFWLPEQEREQCSRGWKLTIREQRKQIHELLLKSPSLGLYLDSVFNDCYQDAREEVIYKSSFYLDLKTIVPQQSPFTHEDTLNLDYLPE